MIVLYDNIIKYYTALTMTQNDLNYPVENMLSTFLTLRTQTTDDSSTITIEFDEDKSADCFFLAYTNLASGSTVLVNYYDSSLALLYTDSLVYNRGILKSYFEKLTTMRTIEIIITNDTYANFYIGKIWIGEKLILPEFATKSNWPFGKLPGYEKSITGQVTGQTYAMLKSFEMNLPIIQDETIRANLATYFETIGNLPHFIDLFEELTGYEYYCNLTINDTNHTRQNDNDFAYRDLRLNYEECR